MFLGPRDLPYLKGGIRNVNEKWERDSGFERVYGMREAENNHRDYGIARKFGSV